MALFAAAARRFAVVLGAIAAGTALISYLLGLATGSGVVGSFLLVAGFFVGNRGPARLTGEEHAGLLGPRRLRWASLEERTTTLNESALLISIGFVLLVVGLLVDDRARLL